MDVTYNTCVIPVLSNIRVNNESQGPVIPEHIDADRAKVQKLHFLKTKGADFIEILRNIQVKGYPVNYIEFKNSEGFLYKK